MTTQSFSITENNDAWLTSLIQSGKYSSKSDIVNDLIHKARPYEPAPEWLLQTLDEAAKSGFGKRNPEEMLKEFNARYKNERI